MKRKGFLALVFVLLTLALACQAPPAASNSQEPNTPEPNTPEPAVPEPAAPPQAQPLVDLAEADLSGRLGVEKGQIRLVSIEEVTWPDGSLGFPKPGMMYIQTLIPGFRMILSQGGQTYEYHADQGSHIEHGD
ncbi:MAG: hypothetical protein Q7R39_14095 [Dehalococcoidia bacterium]|nr:hypothetical protein [Dehalococcoidia bacterium]